jgi:putative ABC transport system ATP-binding protein
MPDLLDLSLNKIKVALPNGKSLFKINHLAIPYGSHVLIQGESGRGKTTFLHLLAGLFSPSEGYVEIGQQRMDSLDDDERCAFRLQKIGVIFQRLNLLDHLTVAENVVLALPENRDAANSRVRNAIERVNLAGRENDRCSYLSQGEQQRVAVARVLAQAPEIILADEPTSSLDQKNADFVIDALISAAKGKTLIVVSHDHRIAKKFQRVIAFEDFT